MKRVLLLTYMENLSLSVLRTLASRSLIAGVAGAGPGPLVRLSRHCGYYAQVAGDGSEMAASSERVLDAAERAVGAFRPDLIVPVDVPGARLAAKLKPRVSPVPFFPFPDPGTLGRMDDKWSFYEFLLEHDLPSPRTRRLADASAAAALTVPVVIKPPADSGGRGVAVVRTVAELKTRLSGAAYPLLAQDYLEGEDVDLSFLADGGRLLAWAVQLRAADGTIRYIDDPRVVDIGRRLAEASSYTGLAHIDMRYDGPSRGRVLVIECNPRFWGTFAFTLGLGADFLGLGMDLALGKNPAPMTDSPVGSSPSLKSALRKILTGADMSTDSLEHIRQKLSDPAPELRKAVRRLLGYRENGP